MIWTYESLKGKPKEQRYGSISHTWKAIAKKRNYSKVLHDVVVDAPLSSISDVEGDYRVHVTRKCLSFPSARENMYVDRILCGRRDYLHIRLGDIFNK